MTTRPVRAAIVGAGLMGYWHAEACRRTRGRVTVVVDDDLARAEALARRHPGAIASSSLASVLGEVDAVHVCTPTPSHPAIASMAIERGRHVLVEKPVASTADIVSVLLQQAAANGALVCPVYQFVFQDGVRRAIEQLASIGPLRHVHFEVASAGAQQVPPSERQEIAVGILDHPLSILMRLAPEAFGHMSWTVRNPDAGEIHVIGTAGLLTASLTVSMSVRPTRNVARMSGERGSIDVDLFHGFAVRRDGTVSRRRKILQPFAMSTASLWAATANLLRRAARREPAYPGLRALVDEFYAAITGETAVPISFDETLEVARARDAIARGCESPR